MVLTNYNTA